MQELNQDNRIVLAKELIVFLTYSDSLEKLDIRGFSGP